MQKAEIVGIVNSVKTPLLVLGLMTAVACGADEVLSCRATRFGALFQPDESPAFDLSVTSEGQGAARVPFDCTVYDWQDRQVCVKTLPGATAARLTFSVDELGKGFGAYRLVVAYGGLTNETGFARLTGPRPRPCGWVGTGVHDGHGWGKGDLRFLDILSEIGIGVVRDAPGWPDVEAEKGVYRVSENFDRFVDGLAARGIGFNMIMSRPNPAYANPLDPDAFARWCGYMAKRYGDRVRTWEIWNEPQHFGFRQHYGPSNEFWVAKFIELTQKADDAIRAVCPDANVAVTSEDEWWLLEKMLYGGIARPHNLVSFHSYCHGQPRPERALFFKDNGAKMRLRAANHGGVKRFALTESGWTTYQGKMKYLEIAGGYPRASLVQQAQYVVRMLILARQLGVEYACQYDFMNDGKEPSFTEHNFGLVRADCSPKPALAAVAQLTRLVGEADPLGDLSDDPQRYRLYRFRQPSGDVYAAWAIEGQVEITLPDAVPEKTVCLDLMGNVVTRPRQGRRLTLDETPVFLKAAPDRDDTAMLQGLLDKGGEISLPARTYNISKKLLFRSSTHLRFAQGARIVLLPRSDCMMAGNADPVAGNFDISIEGGVWDMDNLRQAPNPSWRHYCNPPKPRLKLPKTYDPSFYRGVAIYFENVSNLVVKGITIRNPVTYAFQLCRTAHFAVDNVTLDYTTENPIKGNMDGIHLDGGCHHGKISNIRGTCWDDMVAINANDVYCSACQGAITDIEIDGVKSEYSHSAVRLLSAPDPVERIRIRNVRGHYFLYAIGFTHYFAGKPCGTIRDVEIENVSAGLAPPPPDMWPMKNQPVLYFTKDVKVDGLRIDGFEILPNLSEVPERWKLKPGMVPHRRP